jgi:glycerol uptake facilitator-like aquaporin
MGERLSEGNAAVALLGNSIATGAGLYVLIVMLSPISGAHFNHIVTAVSTFRGDLPKSLRGLYVVVQVCGAIIGVVAAHAMFGLPLLQYRNIAGRQREKAWVKSIAIFGLILVIAIVSRFKADAIPASVAAFITRQSLYWQA